jgi:hypothetical protein
MAWTSILLDSFIKGVGKTSAALFVCGVLGGVWSMYSNLKYKKLSNSNNLNHVKNNDKNNDNHYDNDNDNDNHNHNDNDLVYDHFSNINFKTQEYKDYKNIFDNI